MLSLLVTAQLQVVPHHLPSSLLLTPNSHQPSVERRIHQFEPQQQIQQQLDKLNAAQKRHEIEIQQLHTLPRSRIDCFPRFPPVVGVDPISCLSP